MKKTKQKLPESINQTKKYAVIDETGRVHEKFRLSLSARNFIEKNHPKIYNKLKIVRLD
ncbi:MAG: hypothetical protein ACOC1P_01845 [Minisyncoccales bacterium]